MTISEVLGVSSKCSEAALAGTGTYGCPFRFGLPDGIILIKKGLTVPAAETFDQAYLLGMVQKGDAVPLLNSFSFEPINEDDVLETSVTGVNDLARRGLTSLMFTFKKGIQYERAVESLTGFGVFDIWVVDKQGNFLGVNKNDGDFGGFTAGLVRAMSKTWNNGSESEGKGIEVQLTQPGERAFMTWIEASALGFFAPNVIDGINDVQFSFADINGAVPPADLDTELKVRVMANDGYTPIVGIGASDFRVEIDGANVAATAVDDGDGYYTITVAVASGSLTVKLYDSVLAEPAINVSDILFAGSETVTVA